MSAHESVPGEAIGVVNLEEKTARVVEIEEWSGRGEGKEAACGEGVVEEASREHLGVDLREKLGGVAAMEKGFEDGEVDGWKTSAGAEEGFFHREF